MALGSLSLRGTIKEPPALALPLPVPNSANSRSTWVRALATASLAVKSPSGGASAGAALGRRMASAYRAPGFATERVDETAATGGEEAPAQLMPATTIMKGRTMLVF